MRRWIDSAAHRSRRRHSVGNSSAIPVAQLHEAAGRLMPTVIARRRSRCLRASRCRALRGSRIREEFFAATRATEAPFATTSTDRQRDSRVDCHPADRINRLRHAHRGHLSAPSTTSRLNIERRSILDAGLSTLLASIHHCRIRHRLVQRRRRCC